MRHAEPCRSPVRSRFRGRPRARTPAASAPRSSACSPSCSLLTSLQYAAKVAKPADNGQQSRSAFLRWRAMIHDVFAGANVYVGKNEYPNPPVMAIVLRPFAELPPVAGAMAWFYAKVLMAVLAACGCSGWCRAPLARLSEREAEQQPLALSRTG